MFFRATDLLPFPCRADERQIRWLLKNLDSGVFGKKEYQGERVRGEGLETKSVTRADSHPRSGFGAEKIIRASVIQIIAKY